MCVVRGVRPSWGENICILYVVHISYGFRCRFVQLLGVFQFYYKRFRSNVVFSCTGRGWLIRKGACSRRSVGEVPSHACTIAHDSVCLAFSSFEQVSRLFRLHYTLFSVFFHIFEYWKEYIKEIAFLLFRYTHIKPTTPLTNPKFA